jgi:hypothetical protein
MDKNDCLKRAKAAINGPRAQDYGDAKDNFKNIAMMWSVILGTEVNAVQAILCMDAVKTCRLINNPAHEDSWIDKAGYSALGAEISE